VTGRMQRKTKEMVWAGKRFSGRNCQKNRMVAEMPFELIQGFDFKIKRFEYFQTEFEMDSK
jgi:hypothetical protein